MDTDSNALVYEGSCLCGQLSFSSQEKPVVHLCCHCSDCREATGSDYSSIAFFKANELQMTGEVAEVSFQSDLGNRTKRESCERCGTVVFDKSDGFSQLIGVFSNLIHSVEMPSPRVHVWVSSKLDSTEIPENIKSFSKGLE